MTLFIYYDSYILISCTHFFCILSRKIRRRRGHYEGAFLILKAPPPENTVKGSMLCTVARNTRYVSRGLDVSYSTQILQMKILRFQPKMEDTCYRPTCATKISHVRVKSVWSVLCVTAMKVWQYAIFSKRDYHIDLQSPAWL